MRTKIFLLGLLLLCGFGGVFVINYFALFQYPISPGEERGESREEISVLYTVEEVVRGLDTPWSIVFTSPERILVTERPGRIRIIQSGALTERPLHTFSEVSEKGEEGLMSLVLDPEYAQNRLLYVSLAYGTPELFVKVVRFRDEGNSLSMETIILDKIPAARFHAGSRLSFGPDRKLYITTGDATNRALAQDLSSLVGKILRINSDGSIPADNPFPGSSVWSYGHRNPQGLFFHPETGELYSTEHGPSVFDGPAGGDEVNRIVKGGNYGWPLVSHEKTFEGTLSPLLVFTPAEAPASLLIYRGKALPQFTGDLFFGALAGEGLMHVQIEEGNPDKVSSYGKLPEVAYGRIRALAESPEGFLYFGTSNRDGRGDPNPSDDRIFRIRPVY